MIELPEALSLAEQMKKQLTGKKVAGVLPPTKPHKFTWFSSAPEEYGKRLQGASVSGARGFGIYAEILFDNGQLLALNDGVSLRLTETEGFKGDYQLKIDFEDKTSLVISVGMYGGIYLHSGDYDNEYYVKSRNAISPFSEDFRSYFDRLLRESKDTISAKALLATEQRIPGVGNGVLQDILFAVGINPRTKLKELSPEKRELLYCKIVETLKTMKDKGGRDTEKDLMGRPGGYKTIMSKNGLISGCPVCGSDITKENFLGGTVYYCPKCQPR